MPENGGMFKNKIITLFNENLAIFSLTDNLYQKQLEYITEEDLKDYYNFCNKIEDENFYQIMKISKNQVHSNILLNLKIVLEESYFDLFTTTYAQQKEEFEKKLRTRILNACDKIKDNIERFSQTSYYSKLIKNFKEKEEKLKKENEENKDDMFLDEDELIKRRILKDISVNIILAKSPLLLIEEGRELIVDNLINCISLLARDISSFLTNIFFIVNFFKVLPSFSIYNIFFSSFSFSVFSLYTFSFIITNVSFFLLENSFSILIYKVFILSFIYSISLSFSLSSSLL
jgi:hypothetical protein